MAPKFLRLGLRLLDQLFNTLNEPVSIIHEAEEALNDDDAERLYDEAAALLRANTDEDSKNLLLSVLVESSILKKKKKDFESALELMREGVAIDPENDELRFQLALLLEDTGETNRSLAHLDALKSPDVEAVLLKLKLLSSQGRHSELSSICESTLDDFVANPEVLYYWGEAELMNGNYSTAAHLLNKSLQKKPDSQGYFYMGCCQIQTDSFLEASNSFNQALELEPGNIEALFELGKLYFFMKNDSVRACDYLERVVALKSAHPEARALLADIFLERSEPEAALEQINAVNEEDRDPFILLKMADAYTELRNFAEAMNILYSIEKVVPVQTVTRKAEIFRRQGMLERAADFLETLSDLDEDAVKNAERLRKSADSTGCVWVAWTGEAFDIVVERGEVLDHFVTPVTGAELYEAYPYFKSMKVFASVPVKHLLDLSGTLRLFGFDNNETVDGMALKNAMSRIKQRVKAEPMLLSIGVVHGVIPEEVALQLSKTWPEDEAYRARLASVIAEYLPYKIKVGQKGEPVMPRRGQRLLAVLSKVFLADENSIIEAFSDMEELLRILSYWTITMKERVLMITPGTLKGDILAEQNAVELRSSERVPCLARLIENSAAGAETAQYLMALCCKDYGSAMALEKRIADIMGDSECQGSECIWKRACFKVVEEAEVSRARLLVSSNFEFHEKMLQKAGKLDRIVILSPHLKKIPFTIKDNTSVVYITPSASLSEDDVNVYGQALPWSDYCSDEFEFARFSTGLSGANVVTLDSEKRKVVAVTDLPADTSEYYSILAEKYEKLCFVFQSENNKRYFANMMMSLNENSENYKAILYSEFLPESMENVVVVDYPALSSPPETLSDNKTKGISDIYCGWVAPSIRSILNSLRTGNTGNLIIPDFLPSMLPLKTDDESDVYRVSYENWKTQLGVVFTGLPDQPIEKWPSPQEDDIQPPLDLNKSARFEGLALSEPQKKARSDNASRILYRTGEECSPELAMKLAEGRFQYLNRIVIVADSIDYLEKLYEIAGDIYGWRASLIHHELGSVCLRYRLRAFREGWHKIALISPDVLNQKEFRDVCSMGTALVTIGKPSSLAYEVSRLHQHRSHFDSWLFIATVDPEIEDELDDIRSFDSIIDDVDEMVKIKKPEIDESSEESRLPDEHLEDELLRVLTRRPGEWLHLSLNELYILISRALKPSRMELQHLRFSLMSMAEKEELNLLDAQYLPIKIKVPESYPDSLRFELQLNRRPPLKALTNELRNRFPTGGECEVDIKILQDTLDVKGVQFLDILVEAEGSGLIEMPSLPHMDLRWRINLTREKLAEETGHICDSLAVIARDHALAMKKQGVINLNEFEDLKIEETLEYLSASKLLDFFIVNGNAHVTLVDSVERTSRQVTRLLKRRALLVDALYEADTSVFSWSELCETVDPDGDRLKASELLEVIASLESDGFIVVYEPLMPWGYTYTIRKRLEDDLIKA